MFTLDDNCDLKCSTALKSISNAATCSKTIGASLYWMYALSAVPSLCDLSKACVTFQMREMRRELCNRGGGREGGGGLGNGRKSGGKEERLGGKKKKG